MSTSAYLESIIRARTAHVAVIGMGYVGLPVAVSFAQAGFAVTGIDVDTAKVAQLGAGKSYIQDVSSERVAELVRGRASGRPSLIVTAEYQRLAEADVIQICVPTPCTRNKEPDTSHIRAAAEGIADHSRAGQLVVLRSTSYPGTTRELVAPILESRGRKIGVDTFLAFVPERIDPGRKEPSPEKIPTVIGGAEQQSAALASLLFQQVVERTVLVSTADAAEMTKLLENVFRNVNIALVNQLAMLCDRMGLDVWEIVDAAATKPYGFMKFVPGPGVGGHCIPVDPYYLSWKAREYDFHMDFIELAARVNDEMPAYVVNKTLAVLNGSTAHRGRPRVIVLGVTFKRDVGDERHSPAVKIIELLRHRRVQVSYHDPYVPKLAVDEQILESQVLTPHLLAESDAVVIATDHSVFDYDWIVKHAPLVVDTRNATARIRHRRDRIVRL